MKRPIFTNLAPNTEKDDIGLALSIMFKPWLWKKGQALQELETFFLDYLPIKHAVFFETGRTGLYTLLKSLNLKPDDQVLVQAFTCVAVPNAVIWVGAKPVYVDCDEKTFNMDPEDANQKVTDKTRAIIIQHTFGGPADMDKLLALAREHGLLVIEDCAHAIGAVYHGKKTGTLGDAAIFSFGRDKAASAVFGGLIVTDRDDLAYLLKKSQDTYPYPSFFWIWRQLMHPIITSIAKKTYNTFAFGKAWLEAAKRLKLISKAVEPQERKARKPSFVCHKMPNALAILAGHQLNKLERFNAHREQMADVYNHLLAGLQAALPITMPNTRHTFIRYTILTPRAKRVRELAKRQNIFLGDWYDTPIAPRDVDQQSIGYKPGLCPVAEKLAGESVNLPTDIHITPEDGQRIVETIKPLL